MKIEKCLGKGKSLNICNEAEKFFRNRGEIWNRGEMHHCLRGMDASPTILL